MVRRQTATSISEVYQWKNALHLAFVTDHINAICLPTAPQLRSKSYVNHTPFIAGWGQTQERGPTASILQELQVPIHPNQECAVRYTRANYNRSANQFDSAIICAGLLTGGKDSCKGDSGGPLMIPEVYFSYKQNSFFLYQFFPFFFV